MHTGVTTPLDDVLDPPDDSVLTGECMEEYRRLCPDMSAKIA